MALSEGVQSTLRYKFYSTGVMDAATEPAIATAPGASGGRLLRRVSTTLNLRKSTFASSEIREDRQIGDFRHGTRRVEGAISGEFSPGTYFDFIEASHRDTGTAANLSTTQAAITSLAADATLSTLTFGGGDPVTIGFRVGDVIRLTNLTGAGVNNNNRNFTILGFGGTSNRTITVSPAPTTHTALTTVTVTRPGRTSIVPATGHVSRRVAVEDHATDLDLSRLFTECRLAGYRIGLPAEGMATFEAMLMGRGMQVLTGANAPFFTAPSAITSTGIAAAANGLIRVGGTTVGVVTGVEINFGMEAEAPAVVGQLFPPEIFLGTANVSGTITALFDDEVFLNNYLNEDEISVLVRTDAGGGAAPEAVSFFLPRIKFTGGDVQRSGQGAQPISLPFQALRFLGSTAGVDQTTIRIHDTAAT
jgi:hypothetical protein